MKIAFIITGLGMGGAEKQVCALADKLVKNNDVIIISLSKEKILTSPQNNNIKIYSLEMNKAPLALIHTLIKVRRILNNYKPDIVHSHMFHANIFSRILSIFYKLPVLISTAHNTNEGSALRMFIYRITDKLATISTNVSQEAVDCFVQKKAVTKDRMIVMYNGIDTTQFKYSLKARNIKRKELGLSDDCYLFLAVGRLTEAKNYPDLLVSFSKITRKTLPFLAIIGDGEDRETLIELAYSLNISERVFWLGLRNDVNEWMSTCDTFVLSSSWEGFGLVVAEAMSCQRIVIGTDCGGVSEVIGENGFIIPKNDTDTLTKTMIKIMELDENIKIDIGINARKHIESKFSLTSICTHWANLYSNLAHNKKNKYD